ncbi:transcription elongation factor GreA [Candidatus Woesebacteria bacterium]|nr:transcription elongation factor GreA [Candidatus Woesebacteria bacterium]
MDIKKIQLTRKGFDSLKTEYNELVNIKRPRQVERLANARGEGDLAENSDYANAKDELEFLDGRIAELKGVLENAVVVLGSNKSSVGVGTKVTVGINGNKQEFYIVGEWEADPANMKISQESPLGIALSGKKVGDKVEVSAPAGKIVYEILSIE